MALLAVALGTSGDTGETESGYAGGFLSVLEKEPRFAAVAPDVIAINREKTPAKRCDKLKETLHYTGKELWSIVKKIVDDRTKKDGVLSDELSNLKCGETYYGNKLWKTFFQEALNGLDSRI